MLPFNLVPKPKVQEVKPPHFEEPLKPSVSAVRGDSAVLSVVVSAYPRAKYTWYFNGREIRSSQKYIITEDNRRITLTIRDVQPEDSGEYTVRADNEYGDTTCTATLNILRKYQTRRRGLLQRYANY